MNNRLKTLREEKGLSQMELGKILGISNSTLSNYETGYRSPDNETLVQIADFFKVSTDYLLGRDPRMDDIDTLAAHHEGEDWTKEELEDIEMFKELIKQKRLRNK